MAHCESGVHHFEAILKRSILTVVQTGAASSDKWKAPSVFSLWMKYSAHDLSNEHSNKSFPGCSS